MPIENQNTTRERPMLFNSEMVRALLDGRKTVTRRVMKPQPVICPPDYPRPGHWWPSRAHRSMLHVEDELQNKAGGWGGLAGHACPYGEPGDRLWVRETWYCDHDDVQRGPYLKPAGLDVEAAREDGTLVYAADGLTPYEAEQPVWKPNIHMPRWACRILLEITAVRVERLQDITRSDIRAEGLQCPPELAGDDTSPNYRDWYPSAWRDLWNSTGGDWDANPWVWVVEFKRVTP